MPGETNPLLSASDSLTVKLWLTVFLAPSSSVTFRLTV